MGILTGIVMFGVGLLLLPLLFRLFAWNVKALWKLLVNGFIGGVLLLLFNIVGANWGYTIPINALTSLIAGLAGVPGVVLLAIWYFIL